MLCLFLPIPFVGKIVVGFFVLILFMVLALLRLGPDRVPPEIWLKRRIRYGLDVRKYGNQREPSSVNVGAAPQAMPSTPAPAVLVVIAITTPETGSLYSANPLLLSPVIIGSGVSYWLSTRMIRNGLSIEASMGLQAGGQVLIASAPGAGFMSYRFDQAFVLQNSQH